MVVFINGAKLQKFEVILIFKKKLSRKCGWLLEDL